MRGFRVLLIVVLAAVMDLGSPVLPEAGESFEELEEAAHGRRRVMLLVLGGSPTTPAPLVTAALIPRRAVDHHPLARAARTPARKIPPLPDPASASEDH